MDVCVDVLVYACVYVRVRECVCLDYVDWNNNLHAYRICKVYGRMYKLWI